MNTIACLLLVYRYQHHYKHQVCKILGPPENRETTGKTSHAEVMENDLESLLLADLDFEVSYDVLSNMPLRDYYTNGIDNFSGAIFPNCTIPFGVERRKTLRMRLGES